MEFDLDGNEDQANPAEEDRWESVERFSLARSEAISHGIRRVRQSVSTSPHHTFEKRWDTHNSLR